MRSFYRLFVSLVIWVPTSAFALECLKDETFVRSHNRYINGKKIKVSAHCRKLSAVEIKWWDKIVYAQEIIPSKRLVVDDEVKNRIVSSIRNLPRWTNTIGVSQIRLDKKAVTSSVNLINQEITINNEALIDENKLKKVLIHEYAHLLFATLGPITKDKFVSAAGWIQIDGKWVLVPREEVLIQDSFDSVDEHFSNAIEIFEADRALLRVRNPLIFSALKEILND